MTVEARSASGSQSQVRGDFGKHLLCCCQFVLDDSSGISRRHDRKRRPSYQPCLSVQVLQSPPGSLSKGKKEEKEEVWQKCETSLLLRYKCNLILCRASSKDEVRISFPP